MGATKAAVGSGGITQHVCQCGWRKVFSRLSDRFVCESLYHVERDELVGKSLEGPLGLAWRWRTAPQGHHARCCGAIQEALARGLGLFCADQSGRESVFNNALPDVANRLAMTVEGCGHVRIGPGGPVGIHVEQEVGMFDLRGRSLPALGQWDEFLSCVVCEAHNRGLVHIDSSIPPHAGSWRDRHASITAKNKTERVLVISFAIFDPCEVFNPMKMPRQSPLQ